MVVAVVVAVVDSDGLSFEPTSITCIRNLKRTFWLSCFAKRDFFWDFSLMVMSSTKIVYLEGLWALLLQFRTFCNSSFGHLYFSIFCFNLLCYFFINLLFYNFNFKIVVSWFSSISFVLFLVEFFNTVLVSNEPFTWIG